METFGDKLYDRSFNARNLLFLQGEVAQLTFQSFHKYKELINELADDVITLKYPIGLRPDGITIEGKSDYSKETLIERYDFLASFQLPINGIYQLVTIVEAYLSDIIRDILTQFPAKIPSKKKLDVELVLGAESLDEIKSVIINIVLNELAYKSPKDFADEFMKYTGINLLEKPVFHRYIELKATRDIYIHNQGEANSIYSSKADTLARVKVGQYLPVTIHYFLQSYEACIQLTELLEEEFNNIWPSLKYQQFKGKGSEDQKEQAVEQAIEFAEAAVAEAEVAEVSKGRDHTIKKGVKKKAIAKN
ncbi:hypothetical protein D3C71_89400 [compost metagenome]